MDDKILVFEAGDTVASGRVGIRQVVDEIVNGERKAEYPGIGQWAELLLLDGNNDPIAYVSLVIHGATAVVSRCDRRGDRYFFDLTKRSHSPIRRAGAYQLTRMMYDYLEKNRPEKFAAMNAAYAVHGISIEEVLRAEEKRRNGEH